MQKPPLGLMPRKLFLETRLNDVKRAINEYFEMNQEVPTNWLEEYNLITSELYPIKLCNNPLADLALRTHPDTW